MVKIIVATHKPYEMPKDPMYIPLHVGAERNKNANGQVVDFGYLKDNTNENISMLNDSFCELTGLYWMWKNLKDDYLGLVHYRRHFCMRKRKGLENVLTYSELKPYLGKVKVFVPKKRRYYIETLYSHYAHTHYAAHLDETKKIIQKRYPEYLSSYEEVLQHTYGYMFNMMIMEKNIFSEYCSWLFDILFELKDRIEIPVDLYQRRCFGRVSEIIFNVWLFQNVKSGRISEDEVMEIPYVSIEKINWWKKGTAYLKARFLGRKYDSSF